jgi:predicted membrane GTPase involved in stress response
MSKTLNNLTTKRFVIRKSLIGKNTVITFVNKKQQTVKYNHDEVYNTHKDKFDNMNCFEKYKSYTNSNCVPKFCRDLQTVVK